MQLNVVFIVLFSAEAILKIVSMTFALYIKDKWNVLDFIIVTASVIDLVLDYLAVSVTVSQTNAPFVYYPLPTR